MTIIKVEKVGDEYTGLVTDCAEVKGKFDQQVQFDFENGDRLYLPAKSAARQLIRCGFVTRGENPLADYEAVPGNELTFGRDDNPGGKPYWSIAVANPADSKPRPKAKRMTQEQALSAPPAHHRDVPLPTDPDDLFDPPQVSRDEPATPLSKTGGARYPGIATPMGDRMDAYFALAREVADFQAGMVKEFDIPVDGSSVNAMTYSIWNSR